MAERYLVIEHCSYDASVVGGIFDSLSEALIVARTHFGFDIEVWDGTTLVRTIWSYDFDVTVKEST